MGDVHIEIRVTSPVEDIDQGHPTLRNISQGEGHRIRGENPHQEKSLVHSEGQDTEGKGHHVVEDKVQGHQDAVTRAPRTTSGKLRMRGVTRDGGKVTEGERSRGEMRELECQKRCRIYRPTLTIIHKIVTHPAPLQVLEAHNYEIYFNII